MYWAKYIIILFLFIPSYVFAEDIHPKIWGLTSIRCGDFDKNADPMNATAYKEAVLGYWSGLNFSTSAMQNKEAVKDISVQSIVYSVHDRCALHPEQTLSSAIIDTYLMIAKAQALK